MKKLSMGEIPNQILEDVIDELKQIRNGEIIFVAQDGYLMSVEITARRRPQDWEEKFSEISAETSDNLKKSIRREFAKLLYGRLVLKIQKGKLTQMERTIQQRFTGLDGEGI